MAANFDVRTFGAVADGKTDDRPAIQRAIDAAIKSGRPSEVMLSAGTYHLGEGGASEGAQIQIVNAHGLTITGAPGTVLVSHSPKQHIFGIYNSTDIQVLRLTLDRNPLVFSQATVKAIDVAKKTALVTVDPGYDPLDSPLIAPQNLFIVFSNPETGSWGDHSAACAFYNQADPSACWPPKILSRRLIGVNEWEVGLNTEPLQNYLGKKVVIWSGLFKGHAFAILHSQNVLLQDIVYDGGGGEGGYVISHSRGNITLRRFSIGVPPGSDRLITAISGGMIFNNHAKFLFDHVDISKVWDDDVNIGANFARIYGQSSPMTLRVDGSRGDFIVGDRLAVWDWKKKTVLAEVRIVALACDDAKPASCLVTIDKPVTIAHPGYAAVRSTKNDGDGIDRVIDLDGVGTISIVDSSFQSLHARCMLIKASDSIVENTICHDTVMAGLLVGPQFFWDEGPEVHDLTIRGNIFRNVSGPNILVTNGGSPSAPAITNLAITGNQFIDYGRFKHGVDVESGVPILIQKTENPDIHGNTASSPYALPKRQDVKIANDEQDIK